MGKACKPIGIDISSGCESGSRRAVKPEV